MLGGSINTSTLTKLFVDVSRRFHRLPLTQIKKEVIPDQKNREENESKVQKACYHQDSKHLVDNRFKAALPYTSVGSLEVASTPVP